MCAEMTGVPHRGMIGFTTRGAVLLDSVSIAITDKMLAKIAPDVLSRLTGAST